MYDITYENTSVLFKIIAIDTTECGPRSSFDSVDFICNYLGLFRIKMYAIVACLSATNLQYFIYIIELLVTVGQRISCGSIVRKNSKWYPRRLSAIVASNVPADAIWVSVNRRPSNVRLHMLYFISHSTSINSRWTATSYRNTISIRIFQFDSQP